jgi:hypothetical protein
VSANCGETFQSKDHTHSDARDTHEPQKTLALVIVLLGNADLSTRHAVNVLGGTSLASLFLCLFRLLATSETLFQLRGC